MGPVDLLIYRDSANLQFKFYWKPYTSNVYQRAGGQAMVDFTFSPWGGGWYIGNMRVGLMSSLPYSTPYLSYAYFDWFKQSDTTTFAQSNAYNAFYASQNASLAASGVCATARSVQRVVGAGETWYQTHDLVSGKAYK